VNPSTCKYLSRGKGEAKGSEVHGKVPSKAEFKTSAMHED
jgi:hypothetical protein